MRRPDLRPSDPAAAAVLAAAARPSATASDPSSTATPAIGLELGLGALALGGLVALVLLRRRHGGAGAVEPTAPSAPQAPDAVELELQQMLAEAEAAARRSAEAAARRSAQAAPERSEQGTRGPR
jgi:hypothetical protein